MCGDMLAVQVFLDRQGFSPGEIDGRMGANLTRAIKAFQAARRLSVTGIPDCDTWLALSERSESNGLALSERSESNGLALSERSESNGPLVPYRISAEDAKGPFTPDIPPELPDQASLSSLSYRNVSELVAERFHASPRLLQKLNPAARFVEGEELKVPAVTPFVFGQKPPAVQGDSPLDVVVEVSAAESAARVVRADGSVVFYAPVTSGSVHDPLPIGEWHVTSVSWNPVFHYNPDLFWDADPSHSKAKIPAGPNNPVGVVWIGLDKEHYGIHGTPEPGRIGYTQSHGCVRLTNWDATRLASLVRRGTLVRFK